METSVIKYPQKLHPNVLNRWRQQVTRALPDFTAGGLHAVGVCCPSADNLAISHDLSVL